MESRKESIVPMKASILSLQRAAATRNLFLASALAMLPGFTFGAYLAYTAMALPQLMVPNATGILIDIYQMSWLMTLTQPTKLVGTVGTAYLQDRIGRKRCLVLCSLFQTAACLMVYLASSYTTLLLAFCFTGVTTGMALLPSYSLLSEISLVRLRGALGSLNTLNVNGGYLYGMVMSLLLPVRWLPLVTLLPSAVFLPLAWALPESPIWLLRQGREAECRKVVQWLRGDQYCVQPELKEMEAVLAEEKERETEQGGGRQWRDRTLLIPLAIMCALFTIQPLSGADTISYYAISIFSGWGLPATTVAILFQTTITLGYMVSPVVMARVDTRPQFITALLASALAMVGMGLSLLLPGLAPLAIPCLLVAGLAYGLGVGPVPFVTMSAIFPQKYKSIGMCAGQITRALVVCAQLKAFPYLVSLLGMGGIFLGHALTLALGAGFTLLLVPETRNKSLAELERIFTRQPEGEGEAAKA